MSDDGKRKRRGGKTNRTKRRTTALPRHRQPTINHEKLEAYLAAVEKFVDARNRGLVALRKSRANLDEIVRLLKSGTDPASIQYDIERAVVQLRANVAKANAELDDRTELKTIAKEALGLSAEPQST
jgi:ATP phosphoribosyltransferase